MTFNRRHASSIGSASFGGEKLEVLFCIKKLSRQKTNRRLWYYVLENVEFRVYALALHLTYGFNDSALVISKAVAIPGC